MIIRPDDYVPTDRDLAYSEKDLDLLKSFGVHDMVVGESHFVKTLSGSPVITYQVINTITGVTEFDGADFPKAYDTCVYLENAWAEVMTDKPAILTPPEKKLVLH